MTKFLRKIICSVQNISQMQLEIRSIIVCVYILFQKYVVKQENQSTANKNVGIIRNDISIFQWFSVLLVTLYAAQKHFIGRIKDKQNEKIVL